MSGGQFPPGSPFGPGGPYHQPPPRRRGWLRRNWPWYDRYCTARDIRNRNRRRRRNDDEGFDPADLAEFGGGGGGGPGFGGGGGGRGGGGRGGDGPGFGGGGGRGGGGDGPGFGGGGGSGGGGGGGCSGGGGGRGGGNGCDGCGCDLFHLSLFQVLLLTTPTRQPRTTPTLPARAGVTAIHGYRRWLSKRTPCCPHTPSCSHYGEVVVRRYGLFEGARLAGGRIARCTSTVPHGTADPPP